MRCQNAWLGPTDLRGLVEGEIDPHQAHHAREAAKVVESGAIRSSKMAKCAIVIRNNDVRDQDGAGTEYGENPETPGPRCLLAYERPEDGPGCRSRRPGRSEGSEGHVAFEADRVCPSYKGDGIGN